MGTRGRRYWPVFALLAVPAGQVWAQGLIIFNNRVGNQIDAPVYSLEPGNPEPIKLAGTGFTAQLFGGPIKTPVEQLAALTPAVTFRTGDGAGYIVAPSTAVAVVGVPEGAPARIQLRAWNNRAGAVTNWAQALADPTIPLGESKPIVTPPLGSIFTPPPNLIGLESFSIALRIRLTALHRRQDGQFEFKYANPTGLPHCVEASEDLRQWSALGSMPPGIGRFVDAGATNHAYRFYRILPCAAP